MNKLQMIQQEAIDAFQGCTLYKMAGGSGKTRVSILLAEGKTLWIMPSNALLQNYQEEFERWNKTKLINTKFINRASLKKFVNEKYNTIVADEIHKYSDAQVDYFNSLVSNNSDAKIIMLSANIKQEKLDNRWKKRFHHPFNIFEFSMRDAIKRGIITDYSITVYRVALDDKAKYIPGGNKKNPFFTSELKNYQYLSKEFRRFRALEWGGGPKKQMYANIKMAKASKRRMALGTYERKKQLVKQLLEQFKDSRVIVFTGYNKIADEFCDSYHSDNLELDNLARMKAGEINHLATVAMVNEGENIPPIEIGIIHQVNSNLETLEQQLYRLLRIEEDNPDKIANLHITVYKDTRDEDWLNKAIENLDLSKIKYVDV